MIKGSIISGQRCSSNSSRGNYSYLATFLMLIILSSNNGIKFASAISCYDCRSEDLSCNVGECVGSTCVKMETSNIDNDRKTISKSCNNEFEDNQCKQSYLGLKVVLRCTCDSNFCNGDRNLVAAGLQRTDDSNGGGDGMATRRRSSKTGTQMMAFAIIGGALTIPLLAGVPIL
ncbi:hypothetical protein niasHT_008398 [Heterodera trifolii]|uniref:Protein sleepless n=1 Tax=Heterodera trifolii TaxID=157864 RepID=A0ABD2LNU4_9BILA